MKFLRMYILYILRITNGYAKWDETANVYMLKEAQYGFLVNIIQMITEKMFNWYLREWTVTDPQNLGIVVNRRDWKIIQKSAL
jgi:hypothetical protein